MPSTALTSPSSVSKCTRRSSTSSRGAAISASSGGSWCVRGCQESREEALVAHSRIDEGVEDVHDEAHDDDEERSEQDGALDLGQVEAHDRVEGEASDALDVEDGLGEDRPAEQDADVEAEQRDDRRDRRPDAVAEDDAPLRQALRAGCADVVLLHGVDQVAA